MKMSKRKIIKIDEAKCNGCGLCIPNCPEGAIQIIDGKARLISDLFCDGLGACIGHCPQGAISIEERQAQEYDEAKVMANIVSQGENTIKAHLEHLRGHGQHEYLRQAIEYLKKNNIKVPLPAGPFRHNHAACPGSRLMELKKEKKGQGAVVSKQESELTSWPVQLMLVPAHAPFLNNSDLLIAADCVPFAYANFHQDLLKDKTLLVGCPKLDDIKIYEEKIRQIIQNNNIKSITYAHMEVPCCFGLINVIKAAILDSKKNIPFKQINVSIKGEILDEG